MLSLRTTLKNVLWKLELFSVKYRLFNIQCICCVYIQLFCVVCGHGIAAMTCCSMNRATRSRHGPNTGLRLYGPAASPVWSRSRRPTPAGRFCPATVPSKTRCCVQWRRARVLLRRLRIHDWTATPQSLVKVGQYKLLWHFNLGGDTCTLKDNRMLNQKIKL